MKKASKAKKTTPIRALVITLIAVVALLVGGITLASAASGDTPAHSKTLTANPDGTYTIALNVTGDSERQIQKVNVIVIVDRSGSMGESSGNTSVTYTPTNSTGGWWYQDNLYGLVDGEYVQLERRTSGNYWDPTYTFWYNGTQYTGQRYTRQAANQSRLEATQEAVNTLASSLLANNGKDGNPDDVVEMALVSFATTAQTNVSSTTSATTFTNAVNGITVATGNAAGTNWEAALRRAATIDFGDNDPTYVIFFSDGAPTFYLNAQGQTTGSGYEEQPNMDNSYNAATDEAASLARKVGVENFYTIFAYGESFGATYMSNLTSAAGAPADNNYSAEDTAQLQEAFAEILEKIEMAGIANVGITDGTTSNVQTSSGQIANLLTVDTSSYHYYRAGGTNTDGSEKYNSEANGGLGEEWTDAPRATLEDGAVNWNIDGVLEDGVTYTVTFDCWPSQTTLDIIADIKNDPSAYDRLDPAIQQYIDRDGKLKTNTTATLTYTDTREDNPQPHTEQYTNPGPVSSQAVEQLAVTKKWENELDEQAATLLSLSVTRDGEARYTAELSDENDWQDTVFISIGIMRTGTDGDEILAPGHDFTFVEPADLSYHWELDVPTVRPMMINGTLTMLIKVDSKHPVPSGATTHTIDGAKYYEGNASSAALTATNYRRSSVILTKAVTGEDAPPNAKFPFTLNVVNANAASGSADNINSDYYVWFSVWDKNNQPVNDAVVSGATAEDGSNGWYYAPSSGNVVVNMQAGYKIRINNLPTGSTYTFTEGTLPTGFKFTDSELEITEGTGTDTTFNGDQTTTGTVQSTNTLYTVTFTNEYALVDVDITKVWNDHDDYDKLRPTTDSYAGYLTLKANGEDVTSDYADSLEIVDNGDDTYSVTWEGLPKYDDEGEPITYKVEEKPIDKYEADNTTVDDGGRITNTHEPVTTVSGSKTWKDNDNQDGVRPQSITINLLANGDKVDSATVTADNDWKWNFENLPVFDKDGEEITYTISEDAVDGYTTTVSGYNVTNTHTPDTTSVSVSKKWDDANDQDGLRPASVTVQLLANGEKVDEVTLSDSNNWTHTFSNLPKNSGGQPITYTVTETAIEGYEPAIEGTAASGFTITNKHTPSTIDISGTKAWFDAGNQDGIRPDSITVNLLANGEKVDSTTATADSGWVYTFEDAPEYANGKKITYTVTEEPVEGYNPTISGYNITNTHTPDTVDVTVTKKWDDASDQDGKRPDEITITLTGTSATGEVVVTKEYKLSGEGDEWTYTFEGLPKNSGGQAITYTVTEEEVDGYTPNVNGTIITNVHTPEVIELKVTKKWEDAENQDGIRPGSVTINVVVGDEVVASASVTADTEGGWSYTFKNLPKNSAGRPIQYTVTENAVEGYTPAITGSVSDGFTVTNTHTPDTTSVSVSKEWKDGDNADEIRPDSVTVNLLANGTKVDSATLTEGEEWSCTFENLPVNEGGKKISYTVEEVEVEGYESEITGSAENGFTITNTHEVVEPEPVTSDPPVEKIVKGDPETDETFTFQMEGKDGAPMPEGATDGVMTCQITGSGSHEFGIMTYTEPGEYVYELSEVNDGIEGYTYDTTHYTLTVIVTVDEETGNLTKTETVVDESGAAVDHAVFTNVYEKKDEPTPKPDPKPTPKPEPKPEPKPVIPATGDPTGGALPVALLSLLGGGSAYISSRIRRRKED